MITIRLALYDKGLSAAQAAELIRMPEGTLRNITLGYSERPLDQTLAKIAEGLDLDYAELIEMRDYPEEYERKASSDFEDSKPDAGPSGGDYITWIDPPKEWLARKRKQCREEAKSYARSYDITGTRYISRT
jgi:transcriptional regulator with XRE-family HTH domain